MKIGYDAKRLFFNGSGLGNYSRSTVEMVATMAPEGTSQLLFSPKEGNKYGFAMHDDPRYNIEVCYPSHGSMRMFGSLWRSSFMGADIRRHGVDLFHGLSHELPADIARSGARSIVTMHDLIFVRYPELYKPLDRALYIQKYRKSCNLADRIIAISHQTKTDLVDLWDIAPDKIDVVYQGCDRMFYDATTSEQRDSVRQRYNLPPEQFILSVGTVERRKNLMLTLKAMVGGRITVPLVVCGRWTSYKTELDDFARKNGISHLLHFHNDIRFEDLPAIYQMSSVVVYASLFEGFGIPILEAMNCGVPVITSAGGVFSETGGTACLYVDPTSVEAMQGALHRLFSDSALREQMILKGRSHALGFRPEALFPTLWAAYLRAME